MFSEKTLLSHLKWNMPFDLFLEVVVSLSLLNILWNSFLGWLDMVEVQDMVLSRLFYIETIDIITRRYSLPCLISHRTTALCFEIVHFFSCQYKYNILCHGLKFWTQMEQLSLDMSCSFLTVEEFFK